MTANGRGEPSKWAQAEASGHDVRWDLVRDPDLGVIASVTVNGEVQYTAAAPASFDADTPMIHGS